MHRNSIQRFLTVVVIRYKLASPPASVWLGLLVPCCKLQLIFQRQSGILVYDGDSGV